MKNDNLDFYIKALGWAKIIVTLMALKLALQRPHNASSAVMAERCRLTLASVVIGM